MWVCQGFLQKNVIFLFLYALPSDAHYFAGFFFLAINGYRTDIFRYTSTMTQTFISRSFPTSSLFNIKSHVSGFYYYS